MSFGCLSTSSVSYFCPKAHFPSSFKADLHWETGKPSKRLENFQKHLKSWAVSSLSVQCTCIPIWEPIKIIQKTCFVSLAEIQCGPWRSQQQDQFLVWGRGRRHKDITFSKIKFFTKSSATNTFCMEALWRPNRTSYIYTLRNPCETFWSHAQKLWAFLLYQSLLI